jgi:hypothetical protein
MTTHGPPPFAFDSSENIRNHLNRTAQLGKSPQSQHFKPGQFPQPIKVQASNMNQTTNVFLPRRNFYEHQDHSSHYDTAD